MASTNVWKASDRYLELTRFSREVKDAEGTLNLHYIKLNLLHEVRAAMFSTLKITRAQIPLCTSKTMVNAIPFFGGSKLRYANLGATITRKIRMV